MFAYVGVDAALGQQQSFYRTPRQQMRGNNFIHIGFSDMPIPDGFRVDDHGWPMFTLVQAAGLVDADSSFKARGIDGLLEAGLQLRFAIGITAGTCASGFALVGADKYVPLILCQEVLLPKRSYRSFHHKGFAGLGQFSVDVTGGPKAHKPVAEGTGTLWLPAIYSCRKTGLGWKGWIPTT
jgi:hypothetical protein